MPLPPDLLLAVSAGEANLALVIGAGCSMEFPTSLPSARQLALEVSRRLVADGIITDQEIDNPGDLSALASTVYAKNGSVSELVKRLPIDRLRGAMPNHGYLLATALLHERVVSYVLSLNFDLALQNGASLLGVEIHSADRVGEPVPAVATVVQLHGSASGPANELVLRVEDLSNNWRGAWHQVIANQVLAAPHVLFAGLGSAAPVLSETVAFIIGALGGGKTYYQADVAAYADNQFAATIGIGADRYIQLGWTAVMEELAARVAAEQLHRLRTRGTTALIDQGYSQDAIVHFDALVTAMLTLNLLSVGKFRSHAKLATSIYVASRDVPEEHLAMPMFALANACAYLGVELEPAANGLWRIRQNGNVVSTVLITSGLGYRSYSALEPGIRYACERVGDNSTARPDIVLVAATTVGIQPTSAPLDIVLGEEDPEDITSAAHPNVLFVEDPGMTDRLGDVLNVQ